MTRSRDAILQEIARQEQRLAELERSRDDAQASLESLRAEFATASALSLPPPRLQPSAAATARIKPADKVKLFRTLFRGRLDVFPTRFVSKKTGKPGYAPACSNKWEPGDLSPQDGR